MSVVGVPAVNTCDNNKTRNKKLSKRERERDIELPTRRAILEKLNINNRNV